jgi:hypothetical protein
MNNAAASWIGIEHRLTAELDVLDGVLVVGRRDREAWLRIRSGAAP